MTLNRRYLEDRYGESLKDFLPDVFKCNICGEKYELEFTGKYEFGKEVICEYCIKDNFDRCENCGTIWEKEKGMICPECGERLKEAAGEKEK